MFVSLLGIMSTALESLNDDEEEDLLSDEEDDDELWLSRPN